MLGDFKCFLEPCSSLFKCTDEECVYIMVFIAAGLHDIFIKLLCFLHCRWSCLLQVSVTCWWYSASTSSYSWQSWSANGG